MTPQSIITAARHTLNDIDPTDYRHTDAELLTYVNDGIRECVIFRPEFFSTIGDFTCTPGQCEQTITFADAVMLMEVLSIHGGTALTPFDMDAMSAFNPNWRADTAGPAVQYSKFTNDVLKFFIYPKAPATAQTLDVRYVRNPDSYPLPDTITELPDVLQPALEDYVIFRAESKDDESVNSGRALAAYQKFATLLKG